jgi:YfiH family protein
MTLSVIRPDWPAPANVHAFTTTRNGGYSLGPWKSLNLGMSCGDDILTVMKNRERLNHLLPTAPQWLRQEHGIRVVAHPGTINAELKADAIMSFKEGRVCAVLTADCLPVFFCDVHGKEVAVAHAGWRGLAAGILQNVVASMNAKPDELIAWLGPAIGPSAYEVGDDMKTALSGDLSPCFYPHGDRWLFNLYDASRIALNQCGLSSIHGGDFCTFSNPDQFFSYRRDPKTGRMASLIWLDAND